MNGRLDGPAKYFYPSGAVETRIYEQGVLQGEFETKSWHSNTLNSLVSKKWHLSQIKKKWYLRRIDFF